MIAFTTALAFLPSAPLLFLAVPYLAPVGAFAVIAFNGG